MVELDLIRVRLPVVKGIRGVAQLVEQATDNRQVGGSIPPPTTKAGPVRVEMAGGSPCAPGEEEPLTLFIVWMCMQEAKARGL